MEKSENVVVNFDPRTKFFWLIFYNFLIIKNSSNMLIEGLKIGLILITVAMLFNIHKKSKALQFAIYYGLMLGLGWLLDNGYVNGMSPVGILLRSLDLIILRVMPSVMFAWFVLHSTKVSEFVAGMEKMKIPQAITIPFAVVFRFFPTVSDEYHYIQDAMKMRNINLLNAGAIASLEYRMVPLLVSVCKIGDELSAAAMTRGLGLYKERTNYCNIAFRSQDIVAFFIMFGGIITYILGSQL